MNSEFTTPAKILIGFLILLLVLAYYFIGYRRYEPPALTGRVIDANIVGYSRGSHRATTDPYFIAKLPNGSIIHIRDDGMIPPSFTGSILVTSDQGKFTGMPMYSVSDQSIRKIHNTQRQPTP